MSLSFDDTLRIRLPKDLRDKIESAAAARCQKPADFVRVTLFQAAMQVLAEGQDVNMPVAVNFARREQDPGR